MTCAKEALGNKEIALSYLKAPEGYANRQHNVETDNYRGLFQRDRDRILYSKAFRRLNGKTQVFLSYSRDHVRNRLTHTLEVAQIARTTARQLHLNEDLVEAIALGHDLGHTPFGHVGERVLNFAMNNCNLINVGGFKFEDGQKGFKHNLQGVRVCSELEVLYPDEETRGLNLTNYTLWGMLNHSGKKWKNCRQFLKDEASDMEGCFLLRNAQQCDNEEHNVSVDFYDQYNDLLLANGLKGEAWSFEGAVVNLADEIAQRHHDVEDALLTGILRPNDIVDVIGATFKSVMDKEDRELFEKFGDLAQKSDELNEVLPRLSAFIVKMYNKNLINSSMERMKHFIEEQSIASHKDFETYYSTQEQPDLIAFSDELKIADDNFSYFLRRMILDSFGVQRMDGKGSFLIKKLCSAYIDNPRQLHGNVIERIFTMYDQEHVKKMSGSRQKKIAELRSEISEPKFKVDPKFKSALLRGICDHISGMTDDFVLLEYEKLFGGSPL